MICPNCGKEMKKTSHYEYTPFYHWEDEETYYQKAYLQNFTCPNCDIKYNEDGEWIIPKKLLPTEKQKNTILFINNRLNLSLEAITKAQAWQLVHQYFEEAKKTPLPQLYDYEDFYFFEEDCF